MFPRETDVSTTVQSGGLEVTSNHETPEAMVESLTPPKPEDPQPRVTVKDGQPVTPEGEDEAKVKEAAAELGKRGGKAAAEARKAAEKPEEATPEGEDKPGD